MVSTFNNIIITVAAERRGCTLCCSDTRAQPKGNNDRDNCISKFIFDSAALTVLKEEITKYNEDLHSEVA